MSHLRVPTGSHDHFQGNLQAPLILVEYGDYQCPACGEAYPIVKQLQREFGLELCFVFRNFPLTEVHPQAMEAAETAEFAGANGQFWLAHDALYENQDALDSMLYERLVNTLGLSSAAWRKALEMGEERRKIHDDFMGGVHSGVNGTPTFFINGERHDGGFDFASLYEALNAFRA